MATVPPPGDPKIRASVEPGTPPFPRMVTVRIACRWRPRIASTAEAGARRAATGRN